MYRVRVLAKFSKRFYSADGQVEKTALYDFHVKNGGKMVDFGGFLLPVQYSNMGIVASHLHTRNKASLFDVSHMLQTEIKGEDCISYLESICTADLQTLPQNASTLTVFTNNQGGILDDLIITKVSNSHLYVVSNAAMKKQDQQLLLQALESHKKSHSSSHIDIKFWEPKERSLLALQGPKSAETLQKYTNVDLAKLYFMTSITGTVAGCDSCRITRCGYTGEDGFEISVQSDAVSHVSETLVKDENVELAGLGARDSLRLEAGLCLYGNDITESTTPIAAGLTWLVAKRRRQTLDFPGADIVVKEIKEGVKQKRVGLIYDVGPPARHGSTILDSDGTEIGLVTSGSPSPSLSKNVAMAYVPLEFTKSGTKVQLKIRNKLYGATISKMPFVPAHYYNKPK